MPGRADVGETLTGHFLALWPSIQTADSYEEKGVLVLQRNPMCHNMNPNMTALYLCRWENDNKCLTPVLSNQEMTMVVV